MFHEPQVFGLLKVRSKISKEGVKLSTFIWNITCQNFDSETHSGPRDFLEGGTWTRFTNSGR